MIKKPYHEHSFSFSVASSLKNETEATSFHAGGINETEATSFHAGGITSIVSLLCGELVKK
jgi:hypothetical protein